MNFEWPELLWLLLLVPILGWGYVLLVRRRRRQAALLGAAVIRMSGGAVAAGRFASARRFARHLPVVLMGLALASAIIAAARPSAIVTLPTNQQTVILAIDVSLSMRATDIKPNRMIAAQSAARAFVQDLPDDLRVGLVTFAGTAALVQRPTRNKEELVAAIDRFQLQRQTATGSAILVSLGALFPDQGIETEALLPQRGPSGRAGAPLREQQAPRQGEQARSFKPVPPGSYKSAAIILLSDGRRTIGPDPLEAAWLAAERGVRIFTVGFGTEEGGEVDFGGWSMFMRLDEPALQGIAELTEGEYFRAGSEADLRRVYQGLNSRLVLERAQTEIGALFAGLAALFAFLGAALSVARTGRIA